MYYPIALKLDTDKDTYWYHVCFEYDKSLLLTHIELEQLVF